VTVARTGAASWRSLRGPARTTRFAPSDPA
jgi:hypothetical protein